MTGIKHASLTALPNNPAKDKSADAWNAEHSKGDAVDVLSDYDSLELVAHKGMAGGYAGLDASGHLQLGQVYPNVPGLNSAGLLVLSQVGVKVPDLAGLWDKSVKVAVGDTDFSNQALLTTSTPMFAGLTLAAFSGVLKASAGVLLGGATCDDVVDGSVYKRTHNDFSDVFKGYLGQGVKASDSPSFVALTLTQAAGVAPLTVASATLVSNLNADLWDGYHFGDYLNQAVKSTSSPTFSSLIFGGASSGVSTLGHTVSGDYLSVFVRSTEVMRLFNSEIYTLNNTPLSVGGGLKINGSYSGYTNELLFGNTDANGIYGIATNATGNPVMYFDHRGTNNTGKFEWRQGTGGSISLMYLLNGQLQLPVTGSGGGLLIGGDVALYRSAADTLSFASGDKLAFQNENGEKIRFATNSGIDVGNGGVWRWFISSAAADSWCFTTYNGTTHTTCARITGVGRLELPTQGSSGGLLIGGDVNLYRSAADVLATDDDFKFINQSKGIVLKDRTLGTYHRVKLDNGVLSVEAA